MKFLGKVNGVIFLVLLLVSFLCPSDALRIRIPWRRLIRRPVRRPPVRRPPVRRPPVHHPPSKPPARLPYCPLDANVKNIITRKKFGREIREFKRGTTWPYNCLYASILEYQGGFNYLPLIHTCCNSCSFPTFSTCIRNYGGTTWRCPSQGLQCIVKCVRSHDPNTKVEVPTKSKGWVRQKKIRMRIRKIAPKRKQTTHIKLNPKCERKVKKGGKYCIERLCIPIKLT